MRSWHTAAGFGAMQGMDLQRGATRTLVEEAWVAGSLAVGAWSTPAAPLENPPFMRQAENSFHWVGLGVE